MKGEPLNHKASVVGNPQLSIFFLGLFLSNFLESLCHALVYNSFAEMKHCRFSNPGYLMFLTLSSNLRSISTYFPPLIYQPIY
ncbi:hypothetical protein F5Y08DRAFT_155332 [Xylaria arbuscula]|nr:hypothetical protein F5Y08DRAFT_155332 [Xylaria arbuscula]